MWIEITAPLASIILENRRAFYYKRGEINDLPVSWAAKIIAEGKGKAASAPDVPRFEDPFVPPSLGDDLLTVACVWRTGGIYDSGSYVEKLARGVARNLTVPHRFVCLTDSVTPMDGVETIPLRENWRGYWSKIELYRPGLFKGPVLYLDLDSVVVGSMDRLAAADAPLLVAWDMLRGWLNSSFVLTRVDLSCVWEAMIADPVEIMRKYDSGEVSLWGDQGLLQDVLMAKRIGWQWVQSVVPHSVIWMPPGMRGHPSPAETSVELWYGEPKQADTGGPWLAEHWI